MAKWFIGAFFTAVSAFLAVQVPVGGAQQAAEVRIDSIDTRGYPQLAVAVTVIDSAGRPVVDVPSAGFQATVGDAELPVTAVSGSSDAGVGIGVVLTFDVSGSMAGEAIEQAKAAGKVLLNELGANDEVAIVAFSDNVRLVHPYTQDRGSLMNAIDSLSASGNTALYDGVVGSVDTLRGSGSPRRAAVLLSDGIDFGGVSQNDRPTSIAAAQSVGAPFFVVGLGQSVDQPYLQELANVSRGQLSLAPSPEALRALYESIGSVLRHQYLLTIDGSGVARTGALSLRIQVEHGGVVAAAEAPLDLPAAEATPGPTPGATPKPQDSETPAPTVAPILEEESGGSNLVPLLAGLSMAAGLAGIGGAVLWRRRRRLAPAGGRTHCWGRSTCTRRSRCLQEPGRLRRRRSPLPRFRCLRRPRRHRCRSGILRSSLGLRRIAGSSCRGRAAIGGSECGFGAEKDAICCTTCHAWGR